MKTNCHFWALLKYELASIPWVVWAFAGNIILHAFISTDFYSGCAFRFASSGLSMSGFFLLVVTPMILTPWEGQRGGAPSAYYHDYRDFLFTRAINRTTYFRVKSSTFFLIILSAFWVIFGLSFRHPDIVVSQNFSLANRPTLKYQERFLKTFPNSKVIKDSGQNGGIEVQKGDIAIPYGRLLINAWIFLKMSLLAILAQTFVIGISDHRYQKQIYWTAFAVVFGVFLGPTLWGGISNGFDLSSTITVESFLFFGAHWFVLSLATIVLGIILQVFCEQRFKKMEVLS